MPDNLIEVGVASHRGQGGWESFPTAASTLVNQALQGIDTNRLRVRCINLFATADWCDPENSISRYVRDELQVKLGYRAALIGGSMAKVFCSTAPGGLIDPGLVIVVLCTNDLFVSVECLDDPYRGAAQDNEGRAREREARLKDMAENLVNRGRIHLGTSSDRFLFGILPGFFTDERGLRAYRDAEFNQEIQGAFRHRYRLFGGSAANDLVPRIGYQFADDRCLRSGLALALVRSDLAAGSMMGLGFSKCSDHLESVDPLTGKAQHGYDIPTLDGKPAPVRLRELTKQFQFVLGKPAFGLPSGPDFQIILPHEIPAEDSAPIPLNRMVAPRDHLYLLAPTP